MVLLDQQKEKLGMRRYIIWLAAFLALLCAADASRAQSGLRLGGGIHYLKTVGEIKDTPEFDDDAFNFVGSAQFGTGLFKFEAELEWVPDYGGSDKSLLMPQAFALVGGLIYGGAGIGTGVIDGEWFDKPFYVLRAGVDFPLGPVGIDINANYRFIDSSVFESVDNEDFDSITFGAIVRFAL
jgi:hypothetical protein